MLAAAQIPTVAAPAALAVRGLTVDYNRVSTVLHGVDLDFPAGKIVALLGANGAGKTTLLRAITGGLARHRGRICAGGIELDGMDLSRASARERVRAGIAQVMEGRRVFSELSVHDNLRTGAITRRDRAGIARDSERMYELFPLLRERRDQRAGYLSGGQQQMLAIGRALMAAPRVLLLDEPSLGLAPRLVGEVRDTIAAINESGMTVVLIEQNAAMALSIADHGYVLRNGSVVASGSGEELLADERVRAAYLGEGA